jgi:PAS domain S-box-containing protein
MTLSKVENGLDNQAVPFSQRHIRRQPESKKAVQERYERFRALFLENPEAVLFCDNKFRILDANPSFTALFGFSLQEVQGKDARELIVPEKRQNESAIFQRDLENRHVEARTVIKRKDGSEVNVALSGASLFVKRKLVGYILVYRDITELAFAAEELSKMFEEQNRTLEKTSLLNEKMSVIGNLTRHDVRNKLAAIGGYAYLAKKRSVDNEVRGYIAQIEEVVKNIVRILDFAKAYEMIGSQERVDVNVGKLVSDAASLFTDLKRVEIVNECGDFQVQADSLLMELFHNLIDNSLKYGEKITQIRVYTQPDNDGSTCLIYEDDGVGVDPAIKANIFQKGFGKGTGYGLWLIRRICEMYGWTIEETGEPGKGARFVMKIPKP